MQSRYLLHIISPTPNPSPFDVNMAHDAGWDCVQAYTNVGLDDIAGLVQDAVFSRSPKNARRTGIFIGGRDLESAMDMLDKAEKAMVPPFEVSILADPSGAFTTAAALIATVQNQLHRVHQRKLQNCRVTVFGATGPVGATAAILAASTGAQVTLAGRNLTAVQKLAQRCEQLYGPHFEAAESGDDRQKAAIVENAEVILNTAKAGARVLTAEHLSSATQLLVAADVNAVPPSGIEGVGVQDNGKALASGNENSVGIGALAVGQLKYSIQHGLLQQIRNCDNAVYLHFRHAFEWATEAFEE